MPQLGALLALIPSWVAPVAGLASTGISLGADLASGGKDPFGQAQVAASKAAAAQPKATGLSETQLAGAISPQSSNILEQTSGLANQDYIASIAQLLSGTAGQPNSQGAASSVVRQLFGLGNSSTGGSSGVNFSPAGTTGTTPTGPVQFSDFVSQLVNQ